jgi:hypothetical protein
LSVRLKDIYKQIIRMLLVSALVLQTLLIFECLLRRFLQIFFPGRVTAVQRYANAELLSTLLAVGLNTATLPLQALVRVLSSVSRYVVLGLLLLTIFVVWLVLAPNSVHMYSISVRIYNMSVTPFLVVMRLIFVFVDVIWRVVAPLYNGLVFFGSQILKRIVVPFSREMMADVGEIMKLLVLALGALARSCLVWGERLWDCTGGFAPIPRICGAQANGTDAADCGSVFVALDSSCYGASAHLQLDLVTPGLYLRAVARVLQGIFNTRCSPAALVLNLAIFPLTDYQIYLSVHALVNLVLQAFVGLPVQTMRRCAFVGGLEVNNVTKMVACSPDFKPTFDLATTALQSLGLAIDAWLNFASLQAGAALGGRVPTCNDEPFDADHVVQLHLEDVVLDAARAIEGRTIQDIELLAGRGGLPRSETLTKVRVVGLTARMIAVTDGLNVLYRSVYDGTVFAYGAFPYSVDVRAGLAAVPYTMHEVGEADPFGDRSTGLLGCTCRDSTAGIVLHCATAPYISHVEDDEAAFNATASHRISFPGLSLVGMTCRTTSVRVMPMRWPRARLARAGSHGQSVSADGYSGYKRPSLASVGRDYKDFFTGDEDAVDSLREHANVRRTARVSGVVAAIYVAPACGADGDGREQLRCGLIDDNCFPYCLGLVKAGMRSQNISMHNAKRWSESIVLPDADCGLGRDRGEQCDVSTTAQLVEVAGAQHKARCASKCTPSAVASSVVPLPLATDAGNGTLSRLVQHSEAHSAVFGAVRVQKQPVVVAGDVMLVGSDSGSETRLEVVRLYDVGSSSMQLAGERLTSVVNAYAPLVEVCPVESKFDCVAAAMIKGRVVMPRLSMYVGVAGVQSEDLVLPAASSRFAVHFAMNPELDVFTAYFKYCNGGAAMSTFLVKSSYGRARVWTVQTMRAVDMEMKGEPSKSEVASRVSYMRIPDFFEPTGDKGGCDVIVGLRIVSVEYLNAENVLVTVLAGRPRDYDPSVGDLVGPRHYRYYFLHPQRHDCFEPTESLERGFTCWRDEAKGQFPDDRLISDPVGSNLCPEQRPLAAFGTAAVIPVAAAAAALEMVLNSGCALIAAVAAQPLNPAAAVLELLTLDLDQLTFHSMLDSGGALLFDVDPFLGAMRWMQSFVAGLMISTVDSFLATTGLAGAGRMGEKTAGGLRTLVVGTARVRQGSPLELPPFAQVENLFRAPVDQVSSQASIAVLTSTDGVGGYSLPGAVRMFGRAQVGMASQAELVLRLGRAMAIRLLEAAAVLSAAPASAKPLGFLNTKTLSSLGSIMSSTLVDARGLIESTFLDVMRSQCHGLGIAVGWEGAMVQAVFHSCMVLPDTLEGCLAAFIVLVSDYPAVACVCKQGQGERKRFQSGLEQAAEQATELSRMCLTHDNAVAEHAWVQDMVFRIAPEDLNDACDAAMDGANVRLRNAFDKALRRVYMVALNAGQAADSALAMLTGDTVACDAFDVSPYVLSIVPEPIDYFMHCSDTADCRTRCFYAFSAFEAANMSLAGGERPGIDETIQVQVESMLFGVDDLSEGRAAPPFDVLDAAELSPEWCAVVCGAETERLERFMNRCVVVAGVRQQRTGEALPTSAYYCLPIDMMQYVRRWTPAGSGDYDLGLKWANEQLLEVRLLSIWAAGKKSAAFPRDALLALLGDGNGMLYGRQGVRLILLRAGRPALFLLRTRRGSDPMIPLADLDPSKTSNEVFGEGWLSSLERVAVTPAVAPGGAAIVSVFGHREYVFPKDLSRRGKRRACLRGTFYITEEGEVDMVKPWAECVEDVDVNAFDDAELYENAAGGREWEASKTHSDVCVRAHEEAPTSKCELTLSVPHTRPTSGSAELRIRHGSEDYPVAASESLLGALKVDRSMPTYLDMDGKTHVRVAMLAGVHYSSSEDLADLRLGNPHTLSLIMLNGRDAAAWLHVLELFIPGKNAADEMAAARQRESLRAETDFVVLMECSVQNCAACGQTPDAKTSPQLEALERACYTAQVLCAAPLLPRCSQHMSRTPVRAAFFCGGGSMRGGEPWRSRAACLGAHKYESGHRQHDKHLNRLRLTIVPASCADVRGRPLCGDAGEPAQAVVQSRERFRGGHPRGARRAADVLARDHRLRGRHRGGMLRSRF